MKTSAKRAAGPSLEMLRMRARGMRMTNCVKMSALVPKGCWPGGATALAKERRFSAVKMRPAQTKPSWERVIEARIMDRKRGTDDFETQFTVSATAVFAAAVQEEAEADCSDDRDGDERDGGEEDAAVPEGLR